jgi:hypothetical protein
MHKFSKGLRILAVIVAILVIGVSLGWWATRKTASTESSVPVTAPSNSVRTDRLPFFPTNSRARPAEASINHVPQPQYSTNTNLISDWEDKLEDILGSDADEPIKAQQLLALFPRLPEDGQVEVAQHLSNLVADEAYAPLGKFLTDAKLPEPVLDVLLVDLLNRPNAVKLPLLLEVARDPQHPKAAEAKDLLELYLEEDYGTDWNKWQSKLDQWMKDNPD